MTDVSRIGTLMIGACIGATAVSGMFIALRLISVVWCASP